MNIKKYPTQKRIPLEDISSGDCFMLVEGMKQDKTLDNCPWAKGEVFMSCGYAAIDTIHVVHLETGTIDKFKNDLLVEIVKAHIICE